LLAQLGLLPQVDLQVLVPVFVHPQHLAHHQRHRQGHGHAQHRAADHVTAAVRVVRHSAQGRVKGDYEEAHLDYNLQKYQQQNSRIISDNDRFKKPVMNGESGTSTKLVSMLKQKNEKLLFNQQILNLKSC